MEKKKRRTRYTVNGQELSEEEFKDFSKRFDDIMNKAMEGVDKAMEGVDRAMNGVDGAMNKAMGGMDRTMEGLDKAMDKTDEFMDRTVRKVQKGLDDEAEKKRRGSMTMMKPKRIVYAFVTIWLGTFFLVFGIYFFGKALKGTDTKPLTPASTSLEEKTTQEAPDVFRKL